LASEQVITLPPNLDLCGSSTDRTLFFQLLNLNFEFLIELAQIYQGVSISLPGIPMLSIPDMPTLITSEQRPTDLAWIGGRYPTLTPGGIFQAQGKMRGFDLPAVPGFSTVLDSFSTNIELLAQQLPGVVDLTAVVPLLLIDPCSYPPDAQDSVIAAITDAINNTLATIILQIQTVAGCPDPTPYQDQSDATKWSHEAQSYSLGASGTDTWASTSFFAQWFLPDPAPDPGGAFGKSGTTLTIPASFFGACAGGSLRVQMTVRATLSIISAGVFAGGAGVKITGSTGWSDVNVVRDAITDGLGSTTVNVDQTISPPITGGADFQLFVGVDIEMSGFFSGSSLAGSGLVGNVVLTLTNP